MPPNNLLSADDLQGHWQRTWLKAPGLEDSTTRVHWMQSGDAYADIRIPASRPDLRGATALNDLPTAALLSLIQAEGFAGEITVENGICTWARVLNWHGVPTGIDAGHMSLTPDGDLLERGVHADYSELWTRQPTHHMAAQVLAGDDIEGRLVTMDDRFLFAVGKPDAPPTAPLIAALKAGERPPALQAHFASIYVLGHWQDAQGIADLATHPFLEGRAFLVRTRDALQWTVPSFFGTLQDDEAHLIP